MLELTLGLGDDLGEAGEEFLDSGGFHHAAGYARPIPRAKPLDARRCRAYLSDMTAAPFFDATLTPSRSLDRRGFIMLLSALVALNAFLAVRLALAGGWPILPFLGLDIAGVLIAFHLNYRTGRTLERIRLDQGALTVTHIDPRGSQRNWSFEPSWVRIGVDDRPRGRVTITTHGKGVTVAEFLSPRERREVAAALRDALAVRSQALALA